MVVPSCIVDKAYIRGGCREVVSGGIYARAGSYQGVLCAYHTWEVVVDCSVTFAVVVAEYTVGAFGFYVVFIFPAGIRHPACRNDVAALEYGIVVYSDV